MSVNIKIDQAVKRYGDNTIIPGLDLQIREGELFTLLGASGCGKTTLLRMIAGFNSIEEGTISFNEKVINNIPPHKRNIGMVFQNYAIFPHMTAAENVAFGLKNKKVKGQDLETKINHMLQLVKIEHLKDRLPSNMSGGQQQRLALARAMVMQPDVLLMDEPLSNLDAKLRVEMRSIIKDLQQRFQITTVYVTHDQEEALAISDRIAVMKDGVIQQIGTPIEIYKHPQNIYVGSFIGQSILFDVRVAKKGELNSVVFHNGYKLNTPGLKQSVEDGAEVQMLVRPNNFIFAENSGIDGKIIDSFFLGVNIQYIIQLSNDQIIEVWEHDLSKEMLPNGHKVNLQINAPILNIFDKVTGHTLMIEVMNHEQ